MNAVAERSEDVAAELMADPPVPAGRTLGDVLAGLTEMIQEGRPIIQTIATGWGLLDETVGGLVRGEFIGIVGAPGCGKSTLADQIVVGALRLNPEARGIIIALETAPAIRGARLIATEAVEIDENNAIRACVPVGPLLRGELQEAGRNRALEVSARLAAELGNRLRFIDTMSGAGEIAALIEQERPDVVLLDHLGLVQCSSGADSDVSRLDHALSGLTSAIRISGSAGLVINEATKAALADGKIDMSASRGSARFASLAAAYIGLAMSPPKGTNGSSEPQPEITALLDKCRFGPRGCRQPARFFGGLAYFGWGNVENADGSESGDA